MVQISLKFLHFKSKLEFAIYSVRIQRPVTSTLCSRPLCNKARKAKFQWYESRRNFQICQCKSAVCLQFTMLQKLSKCEVKAGLCWNLWSNRHSDFMWNQILANSNSPKMSFLQFQRLRTLNFGKFWTWKLLKLTKIKIQNL